jgi:hypothetical protein
MTEVDRSTEQCGAFTVAALVQRRALLPVGNPSSPGSPPGSKHPGLKGGPLVPGEEPGLKEDL